MATGEGLRRLLMVAVLLAPSGALGWLDPADPSVQVVLDTHDTQFSFSSPDAQSRWLLSYGRSTTTRIRGFQDVTALKFDLSGLRGRTVAAAELHLAKADSDPTFALVASTINTDWDEGGATGGTAAVGDPCWRWRRRPANTASPAPGDEWTFRYSDVSTASFGNYGTLVCYAYATEGTYGTYSVGDQTWIRMRLDPALVQGLILDQYGLVVTDSRLSTYTSYNPDVYTKEAGAALQPRLHVQLAAAVDTVPPEAVGGLAAAAGPEDGEAVVSFAAPADPQAPQAFGYTVRHSSGGDFAAATDVARWRIPRPRAPGTPQRLLIEDLAPGATYTFFVQAYDAAGNGGAVRSVTLALPAARPVATLASAPFVPPGAAGKSVRTVPDVLRYWAAGEIIKVNPVTGNRMEDGYTGGGADDYKKANVVWDAAANAVSLAACRNEVVGAQLFVERLGASLADVQVQVSDLAGPGGARIAASPCVELFQLHYMASGAAWYADAAIPLFAPFPTTFDIPDPNHNPQGKNQSVWLDLYVPKDTPAGDYRGTITIRAAQLETPVSLELRVAVSPLTIPDYPTFLVDYNGYGNPWDFGDRDLTCLRYFQAAHKHRAVCNTLPYGWNANVRTDRCPTLAGEGPSLRADDWSAFDGKYGRFFDGSAFRSDTPGSPYCGPGMDTPITHLYTTFFESWPIHILDPVYGFDAAGLGGDYWNDLNNTDYTQFFATVPDIYPSIPQGYAQGVRNVVADWFRHAHQKGWTRTAFQIYLNHKYYYEGCAVLWELEEVESADDFRAVGYFHTLYRDGQALAAAPDVKWHFRIDISDRLSQNWGRVDNLVNLHVVNHRSASWCWRQMEYRPYVLDTDRQEQWMWYNLGAGITARGIGFAQLFLQKWSQGYDGGLPYWDNYQMSDNGSNVWNTAHPGSLVNMYSGANVPGFGLYEGPIMSTRAKMMRQAQQVVELLNAWAGLPGCNRPRVRDAVSAKYGNGTWDYSFGGLDEVGLYRLRADLVMQLESLTVRPGDLDGDGKVGIVDLLRLVNAFGAVAGESRFDSRADIDRSGRVDLFDLLVIVNRFGEGA